MVEGQITYAGTANRPVLVTPMIPLHGATTAGVFVAAQSMTNLDGLTPAIRTGPVRADKPTGSIDSGTAITTDTDGTVQTFGSDPALPTDEFWIQAVLLADATDTTGGTAYCKLQLHLDMAQAIVASRTINAIPAGSNTTIIPISGAFPVMDLTGWMGAFQVRSVSGTLAYSLLARYFSDPTRPEGSWATIASRTNITGAEEHNTGDVTGGTGVIPGASDLYGQVAIGFSGSDASAVISAIVSGKFRT